MLYKTCFKEQVYILWIFLIYFSLPSAVANTVGVKENEFIMIPLEANGNIVGIFTLVFILPEQMFTSGTNYAVFYRFMSITSITSIATKFHLILNSIFYGHWNCRRPRQTSHRQRYHHTDHHFYCRCCPGCYTGHSIIVANWSLRIHQKSHQFTLCDCV